MDPHVQITAEMYAKVQLVDPHEHWEAEMSAKVQPMDPRGHWGGNAPQGVSLNTALRGRGGGQGRRGRT